MLLMLRKALSNVQRLRVALRLYVHLINMFHLCKCSFLPADSSTPYTDYLPSPAIITAVVLWPVTLVVIAIWKCRRPAVAQQPPAQLPIPQQSPGQHSDQFRTGGNGICTSSSSYTIMCPSSEVFLYQHLDPLPYKLHL